jgi:PHP family Zn ribbon phosphoesterase
MQRVEELARRSVEARPDGEGLIRAPNGRPPFRSMVSLAQILSEALGRGLQTKTVGAVYERLIEDAGNELAALVSAPLAGIERVAGERTAEGVDRVRRGEIAIEPGFDGRYGKVTVWPERRPQ